MVDMTRVPLADGKAATALARFTLVGATLIALACASGATSAEATTIRHPPPACHKVAIYHHVKLLCNRASHPRSSSVVHEHVWEARSASTPSVEREVRREIREVERVSREAERPGGGTLPKGGTLDPEALKEAEEEAQEAREEAEELAEERAEELKEREELKHR
jgi:hypothetical protein